MKTGLIVSCPQCGKETEVAMEQQEIPAVVALLSAMRSSGTKQYSYGGHKTCACGNRIICALTVTGGQQIENS